MPPASYERIPLEAEELYTLDTGTGHYPPGLVKPPTYYGEGEFDPPSSDEDEEDLFVEKTKNVTFGDSEQEGRGVTDGLNDDVELVVGGHKVLRRQRHCHKCSQVWSAVSKILFSTLSCYYSRLSRWTCDAHWRLCRFLL